jgi:Kelch motif
LTACGGGGGGADASPAPAPGAAAPAPTPAGSASTVRAALVTGTYFEYLGTSSSSSASSSGSSTGSDHGVFRITLGAAQRVGGVDGFAVSVTGKTRIGGHEFKPSWTFLGLSGQRWVASSDGVALATLYDPAAAQSSGFFLKVPTTRTVRVTATDYAGTYNRFPALALSDSASDGGCQTVLGQTLCSDNATSFSQIEYLKDGVGPVGFSQRAGYSYGGSAPQVINSQLKLELIGSSLAPSDGSTIVAPPWSEVAVPPAPVVVGTGAFAAGIGGRIHVYGGSINAGSRVDVYDPAQRAWSRVPDAPVSLRGYHGAVVGTRVVLLKGRDGYLHDPATNTWASLPRLPAGSGSFDGMAAWTRQDGAVDIVAVVSSGPAYVDAQVWRFSFASGAWSQVGSFDRGAFGQYETAMAGNVIYLIGGYQSPNYLGSIQALDLAAMTYRRLTGRLAAPKIDVSAAVLGGRVYLMGGYNRSGAQRDVDVLDPATGQVTGGPALLGGRYGAATAVLDGRIYLIGGATDGAQSTEGVAVLTP